MTLDPAFMKAASSASSTATPPNQSASMRRARLRMPSQEDALWLAPSVFSLRFALIQLFQRIGQLLQLIRPMTTRECLAGRP